MAVRPTGIAPIDALLTSIRRAGGTKVLTKWGILLPLKRALERGEMVGLLADEDARERPIFVPFLGTLAATTPSAAFLQRVTGAPIVVASVNRVGARALALPRLARDPLPAGRGRRERRA